MLSRFGKGDTNFTVENNSGCNEDNATGPDDACVAAAASVAVAVNTHFHDNAAEKTKHCRH